MIVVEGRARKSKILEDYSEYLLEVCINPFKVDIIDYVGVLYLFSMRFNYCRNAEDMLVKDFPKHYRKNHESFQSSDYLILSLNAPKEILNEIKEIEKEFNKKIIVTIESNDKEEVEIYTI